ncbi:energy-coupling factor ABC transporter ATP-binding protein [Peribacillus simplex]|uniref:Energy-coupling factor transporter ATP-binding protein EcfA2 n=2 Tax=Peribacillus TaxID=2675229 RepID=A0AA90SLZ0_9BACI|nr:MULTISPECIES: energy-coupling factor ABC transporter ATP-binding protein [Peribacillus]MDP1420896.1 energy-coupling factor ABC transporter ATP-binding protein [Peribacillus simplex]MDP1453731.1 energy-coupling factor ABC transporter ATP-binding protein [Peribacillus frigoritolerans]
MRITLDDVEYRYQVNTPFEHLALHDVNISMEPGAYTAIIGHTGSGKSTLLQHLNALLKPTKGRVFIGDRTIEAGRKEKALRPIRQKVGIVFQFPEHQLFDETVEKDICFGPMNFGVSEIDAKKLARKAIAQVGLNEEILQKSPFDLSGGQMRRVAIAGVLAMEPEVLVLDEPTAGLDPRGRKEIMDMFYDLHKARGISTILVTHSMEDAAKYADDIIIMHKGTVFKKGTPQEIFSEPEQLMELGLDVPDTVRFQLKLQKELGVRFDHPCLNIGDLAIEIDKAMKRGNR